MSVTAPVEPTRDLAASRRGLSPRALLALTAAFITATSIVAWRNGLAGIDLAIFDQGLWTASRDLRRSASIIRETLFEDHFAPGMLLFTPLYRLVATPIWLLLAQGIAAYAAVRLIYERLRPALGERTSAWIGCALLVSPPVAYALLWDVHFVVLAVPFALAALFAIEDGRPRWALLLGLAAAAFRIEVGFAVLAAFAVLPGARRDRIRPAAVLLAYLLIAEYFEQKLGHSIFWPMHYAHLGASPFEALTHPHRVIGTLFSGRALAKALPWVATSAFIALRRPRLAVPALVVALPVLLSHWGGTDSFTFQYGYAPTLLLAPAWISVLRRHPDLAKRVVGASLVLALLLGPVFPALAYAPARWSRAASLWKPDRSARCLVRGIPAAVGVSVTDGPLTLLAERQDAYLWPFPFEPARSNTLPGPQHRQPVPELAQRVDYLIVFRSDLARVPQGFVEDGSGPDLVRFRRTATTVASPSPCR